MIFGQLSYVSEYLPILIFLGVAGMLAMIMFILPLICAAKKPNKEKLSPYECGFEPIGDPRKIFEVRFYLVAILFIIFDLEITFLFPWAISLGQIGFLGFLSMIIFLLVLTIGFIYEWQSGALEWE